MSSLSSLHHRSNSSKNDELCNCGPPLRRVEYTSLEKKNPNTRFKDGLIVRVSKEGSVITCQRCFDIGHNNKTCKNEPVAPPPKIAKKKRKQRKVQEGDMETEGGQTVGGQSGPRGQTVGGQGGNATTASASGNGKNEFVLGGTYPGLGVSSVGNHASKGGPKSIPKWWGTGVTNCPVIGETFLDGRDSVPVPPWPPGVPMPSASEMAKKIAATMHNLIVDSGSQIGAAKPSQQATPKKKQQTGQQPPPHRSRRRFLKIKPTAAIQPERRSPTLLKKKGATSASGSKTTGATPKKRTPTAAKPFQQVTPKKKLQTGQQPPPHRSRPRFLKIKPTAAIRPERRSPALLKKKGATSASGSKTTGATPKKRTPTASKPSQQTTPTKKQQTGQQPPPHKSRPRFLEVKPTAAIQQERSPTLLKKNGATSGSGSKTTGATPKKGTPTAAKPSQQATPKKKQQTSQQPPPHKSRPRFLKIKPTAAIQPDRRSPRLLKKKGATSASGSKTTAAKPKKRTSSERIVKKKLSVHVDGPGYNTMTDPI